MIPMSRPSPCSVPPGSVSVSLPLPLLHLRVLLALAFGYPQEGLGSRAAVLREIGDLGASPGQCYARASPSPPRCEEHSRRSYTPSIIRSFYYRHCPNSLLFPFHSCSLLPDQMTHLCRQSGSCLSCLAGCGDPVPDFLGVFHDSKRR
jgi:hypothetical protein